MMKLWEPEDGSDSDRELKGCTRWRADQQVVDEVSSFAKNEISPLEVVWMQSSTNQVNGTNEILFHYCVLRRTLQ